MKKYISLLTIPLLLMSFIFLACSDDDDDDDSAADDDATEETYDGWRKIAVEPNMGWVLQAMRLAVDSQNKAHLVYLVEAGDSNYDLYYAYMNGGQAVTERIDQLVGTWSPAIAVDKQDHVHLCYFNTLTNTLVYATNQSGAWVLEDVNDQMPLSLHYDLAVDTNGAVYILYSDIVGDVHSLILVTNRDGDWQDEIIWEQQMNINWAIGSGSRIQLDGANNIHVIFNAVYSGYGDVNLHYLHQESEQWIDEEILADGMALGPIELTVETDGTVHMSCVRDEGGVYFLKYIRGASGNWQIDFVPMADSENLVDQEFFSSYFAMDVDQAGHPHFAMRIWAEDDYRLQAMRHTNGGWSRELLYWFKSDHWIDLALDGNGKEHIAMSALDEESSEESHVLWYVTDAL